MRQIDTAAGFVFRGRRVLSGRLRVCRVLLGRMVPLILALLALPAFAGPTTGSEMADAGWQAIRADVPAIAAPHVEAGARSIDLADIDSDSDPDSSPAPVAADLPPAVTRLDVSRRPEQIPGSTQPNPAFLACFQSLARGPPA